jgi:hypothetical protein
MDDEKNLDSNDENKNIESIILAQSKPVINRPSLYKKIQNHSTSSHSSSLNSFEKKIELLMIPKKIPNPGVFFANFRQVFILFCVIYF